MPEIPEQELLLAAPDQELGGLGDGEEREVPVPKDGHCGGGVLRDLVAEGGECELGDAEFLDERGESPGEEDADGAAFVE